MKKYLIFLMPLLLLFATGCNRVVDSSNHSPSITSVSSPVTSVSDNASVLLSVVASDADGDALTYKWTSTAGVIPTDNLTSATWLGPDYSGASHTVFVSVSISDGKASTSYMWTFSVNPSTTPATGSAQLVTTNQQYSQPVTVDPKITPSTPTGFYANTQVSEIYLKWDPVTTFKNGSSIVGKLSKYRIYRATREAGPFDASTPFYLHVEVPAGTTTFNEVAIGVQYWYKITAVSTSGNESLQSGTISSIDNIAPGVPTIKGFAAYNPYSNDITLWWDNLALTDLAGYRIYRADASKLNGLPDDYDNHDGQYYLVGETGFNSFTDQSITSTGNFYYRITAYDFSGNESVMSEYGWVNNVTPSAVSGIAAVAVTQSVTVYWSDNWSSTDFDKAGYRLYYQFTAPTVGQTFVSGIEQVREDELVWSKHKYTMAADSGRTYYFMVAEVDIFGNLSVPKWCSVTVP